MFVAAIRGIRLQSLQIGYLVYSLFRHKALYIGNKEKTHAVVVISSRLLNYIHMGLLRAILCKNQTKLEMKNFDPQLKFTWM